MGIVEGARSQGDKPLIGFEPAAIAGFGERPG